jgi:low temperature requirement protein LtrA
MAANSSISSPEDQSVTFIELFFDLVFVFAVTQVVSLFHDGIDWEAVGKAILVFWMVWWAWTQFTWALNAADTTHALIEVGTLVAVVVAFMMAVALPDAFEDRALWFAVPYVLLRVIGLGLYIMVAREDHAQREAVQRFALASAGGMVAVLIGAAVGDEAQYALWGVAIALDILAAMIGGRSEGWNLHPEHFTERHGLFVIIVLGETLIIAAAGLAGVEWTAEITAAAMLAVGITCGLWWSYFARAKPSFDHAMNSRKGSQLSMLARDVFSLLHFPILFGVIACAVAVEEAVAHPEEPFHLETRLMLAAGLVLFMVGLAVAKYRASRYVLVERVVLTIVTAIIIVVAADVAPWISMAIAFAGLFAVSVVEHRIVEAILEQEAAEAPIIAAD